MKLSLDAGFDLQTDNYTKVYPQTKVRNLTREVPNATIDEFANTADSNEMTHNVPLY